MPAQQTLERRAEDPQTADASRLNMARMTGIYGGEGAIFERLSAGPLNDPSGLQVKPEHEVQACLHRQMFSTFLL